MRSAHKRHFRERKLLLRGSRDQQMPNAIDFIFDDIMVSAVMVFFICVVFQYKNKFFHILWKGFNLTDQYKPGIPIDLLDPRRLTDGWYTRFFSTACQENQQ